MVLNFNRCKIFEIVKELGFFISRSGKLHKIVSIEEYGYNLKLHTACGQYIVIRNSKRSKAARWIRNKWLKNTCKGCKIKSSETREYSSR